MNKPVHRVLIVDDHPLMRQGIRQILESAQEWQVVAEADSGEAALSSVAQHLPDLILLDLSMKGMSGLKVLEHLRARDYDKKIVLLTVSDSADDLIAALRLGADGYLLKDTEANDLLAQLAQVMEDKVVMSPPMVEKMALSLRENDRGKIEPLTPREQEIVSAIAAANQTSALH
jgi:DNA-binding NarL/FixJ family response regulator